MYVCLIKCYYFDFFRVPFLQLIGKVIGFASFMIKIAGFKKLALKYALVAHRTSCDMLSFKTVDSCLKDCKSEKWLHDLVSEPPTMQEVTSRFLVVRWPSYDRDNELSKGILIITFTRTFSFFLKNVDIARLQIYFHIVLEPSSSGYFDPDILLWNKKAEFPVFIQSSEITDMASIDSLCGCLVPISIGASDWVDYRIFSPLDEDRVFDSVYVSSTLRLKRSHRYLKAIHNIKKQGMHDYKGALICAKWGDNVDEIKSLFKHYNIESNCELLFGLNKTELRKILCQTKLNMLLSKKEGSNRSLFEAMFCDTPVLALADNVGVNKSYINEFTGILAWDYNLENVLLSMRNKWVHYRPRDWAMNNISPEVTMEKLCRVIAHTANDKKIVEDLKQNKNIFYKVNRPEIEYLNYLAFDKYEFNSKFISIFLMSNSDSEVHASLSELKVAFDSCIGEGQ